MAVIDLELGDGQPIVTVNHIFGTMVDGEPMTSRKVNSFRWEHRRRSGGLAETLNGSWPVREGGTGGCVVPFRDPAAARRLNLVGRAARAIVNRSRLWWRRLRW